jgi:hypothetical protein
MKKPICLIQFGGYAAVFKSQTNRDSVNRRMP